MPPIVVEPAGLIVFFCGAPASVLKRTGGGPLFGRALAAGQIERGIDQRDMRKRLRKIPDLTLRARVVFLCQGNSRIMRP
jgi:hypothetical protein